MKTNELTGAQLDFWIGRAEGYIPLKYGEHWFIGLDQHKPYSPSTNWALGGAIIDSAAIDIDQNRARAAHVMARAVIDGPRERNGLSNRISVYGPTALVAAMRAFVASKFGDEVPDETGSAA